MTNDSELGPLFNHSIGGTNERGEIFPAIIKEVDGEEVGIISFNNGRYSIPSESWR